jgi:hypothetical protein
VPRDQAVRVVVDRLAVRGVSQDRPTENA